MTELVAFVVSEIAFRLVVSFCGLVWSFVGLTCLWDEWRNR